jgi:hypothetical protein
MAGDAQKNHPDFKAGEAIPFTIKLLKEPRKEFRTIVEK